MDWIVALTGDEIDLQELAKVWNSPELTIEKDKTAYVLKSTYFASLTDQEIREKANELLVPINAGIILTLGALNPIKIGQIMQIKPDGTRIVLLSAYAIIKTRAFACMNIINEDGKQETHNPADPVISLFNLEKLDPQVEKICQYINQDFNSLPTLYKIYEIIEADGFPPLQKNGEYFKKAALFRRTVNNPSSSGLNSRHAIDKSPPENPMTNSDAQSFIKMLIQEWLEMKRDKIP